MVKVGVLLKVKREESKSLSDAIDRITEGLEKVVELYNESEEDEPLIQFEPKVIETIENAKKVYGTQVVTTKLNNVVKEMLSWLDLEEEKQVKKKSEPCPLLKIRDYCFLTGLSFSRSTGFLLAPFIVCFKPECIPEAHNPSQSPIKKAFLKSGSI